MVFAELESFVMRKVPPVKVTLLESSRRARVRLSSQVWPATWFIQRLLLE